MKYTLRLFSLLLLTSINNTSTRPLFDEGTVIPEPGTVQFPWGVYITPEDTILRYFKHPPKGQDIRVTLQLCTENHTIKTPDLNDLKHGFYPGQRFLIHEQLSNIYLPSWLAACNKLSAPPPNISSTNTYLATLASSILAIEGTYDVNQFELWPTLVGVLSPYTTFILGLSIPIRNIRRSLSGTLSSGSLLSACPPETADGCNSLEQFFNDFNGVEDFINQALFQPKGIALDPQKSTLVVPKITVDNAIYLRAHSLPLMTLIGLRVAVPAVTDRRKWSLDSFIPENLYSTQITLFGNWIARLASRFFPYALVSAIYQCAYTSKTPLRQIKTQHSCIYLPPSYQDYEVAPFSRIDSSVPELADQIFCTKTDSQLGFACGLGIQYFPTGEETVSVIGDYRIITKSGSTTMPKPPDEQGNIVNTHHPRITTQIPRIGITLIGDNYFTLFTAQMNFSAVSTELRTSVCFGMAL